MKRFNLLMTILVASTFIVPAVYAADVVKLGVDEIRSGAFKSNGDRFIWGIQAAVKEANDAGGILGKKIELVIEDRGPGLPEDVRQRLFQPFVTGRPNGVGLGLSLTHRIVTLHGGTVDLEDRSEGGTRVTLSFPVDVFE